MRRGPRVGIERRDWRVLAIVGCWLLFSCAVKNPPAAEPKVELSPLEYSFGGVDGNAVVASALRGRVTVLLFVTTFDLVSQAQAKRLEDLYRTHAPRINALAVVMEAPKHAALARSFRDVLKLNYTLAISSKTELSRHPVFCRIESVPAWIVLDPSGRPQFSASGGLSMTALEEAVTSAQPK